MLFELLIVGLLGYAIGSNEADTIIMIDNCTTADCYCIEDN